MKKLFVFAMAIASISFVSCGNGTNGEVATDDSLAADTVATLETGDPIEVLNSAIQTADASQIQTLISQATEKLQNMTGDEAKEYAFQLQKFVEEHKAELEAKSIETTTVSDLVNAVTNVPEAATEAATAAKEAAKADAQKVADDAKAAAQKKADEAVNAATQKAAEKTNSAIDAAAAKTKSKLGL